MTDNFLKRLAKISLVSVVGGGLLASALSAGMGVPMRAAANDLARPNIVILYADDLGYGDVGCYGATRVGTPNIDRLAREGLRFTDGHATAATCTPSRYSLLTGNHAFRTPGVSILKGDAGLVIKSGTTTLPAILGSAGYETGIVGKWHLGLGDGKVNWNEDIKPGPMEVGFGHQFIIPATQDRVPCVFIAGHRVFNLDPSDPIQVSYESKVGDEPTGHSHPQLLKYKADHQHSGTIINGISRIGYMSGGTEARWNDEKIGDVLVERAKAFIGANKSKPFFLFFGATEPHVPRTPHPRFVGKTGMGPRGDVIVQFDWEVGQIMDALEKYGVSRTTIVILSSDNGPVLMDGYQDDAQSRVGAHKPAGVYSGGKYSVREGGTRVPFIVRWPERVRPGVSDALVSQVDLLASLAALVERPLVKENAVMDSMNVLPTLLGEVKQGRAFLVQEGYRDNGFGYREGEWKITQAISYGDDQKPFAERFGTVQLFNLTQDPAEQNDLAEKEPDRVAGLQAALKAKLGAAR